ncbi:helix-turn-helix domain-containing protein [Paenibacillus thiaminolyticus]|uniref:helix-turn-helix domain-containing protein n=1 Tax=Paenibacillus thiaminolyticus TaxID=49283 RepID=UPI0023509158|nr:helix-turn-helix domain-containing protein [Paenibacillus thiaminolyticus]WCR26057.1 helix-turn-helix domain-containing protein [Paenibacillus thiaminolyticus]
MSQYQIIDKYKIASRTQLSNWIKEYIRHSGLKAYSGGAKAMTKGCSTTWQDRIDIVQYCLAHQHDYRKTADHFQVSYQQVYQWVKKFEEGGQDAIKDGRGRTKAPKELTEADRCLAEPSPATRASSRLPEFSPYLLMAAALMRKPSNPLSGRVSRYLRSVSHRSVSRLFLV